MPTRPMLALSAVLLALVPLPAVAGCDKTEATNLTLQVAGAEHPVRLQSAEAMRDETGASIVAISLCPESAALLARLSGANVGAPMVLALADETLISAVINEPLNTGAMRIAGVLDVDAARTLAERLAPQQVDE